MTRPEAISPLLTALLGGQTASEFATAHWGRAALHHEQLPTELAQAVTRDDLAKLLARDAPYRDGAVRASLADTAEAPERSETLHVPAAAQHAFATGSTVILQHAERYLSPWHIVPTTLHALADLTSTPPRDAQAAVFLSPPSTRAFPRHRDDNEVFTIQVEGSKCWELFRIDPTYKNGLPMDAPPTQVTMNPGCFLYTPRNLVHTVQSSHAISLSIALILRAPTWRSAVRQTLDQHLSHIASLSVSLPFGDFCFATQAITPPLQDITADPANIATDQLGIDRIALLSPEEVAAVSLSTFERVSRHWRLEVTGDKVTLLAGGGVRAEFPASLHNLLSEIAHHRGPLSADDVGHAYAHDTKIRVLRSLLQKGLLRV